MSANVREEIETLLHATTSAELLVFGPMNALLLAARMLKAEGYTFEQVQYGFAAAMECLQEEPRDASA